MGWDLTADTSSRSFHISVACGDLVPVQSSWILEGQMVIEDGSKPCVDDSTRTVGGGGGSVDDLRASEAEAISRAGARDWVTPVGTILLAILGIAIGGGAGGVITSSEPPLMPFPDVIVEAGDDEGTCLVVFWVERYAAGKDVCSTTGGYVFSHVEIQVEEASAIALDGIFGGIGIGDETPRVVGAGSYHECVPDRVLTEELLDEAVEHVAEEAHLWTARDGAVMVVVHGKLSVDGGLDVWLVEMVKNVGEDDAAVCMPGRPGVGSCEAVEDMLGVELEG